MWLLQGHQAWQLWVTNQEAARDHRLQLSSTFRPRPPLNTLEIVHLRTPPTILTAGTDKPVEQEVTLLSITRQFTLNPQEIPWIPSLPIRIPKTWRMNRWRSSLQQNFGKSLTDRLTLSICTRPYRFIFLTPCVVLLSFTQTVVLKLEWQKVYRYFGSFVYFVKRTSYKGQIFSCFPMYRLCSRLILRANSQCRRSEPLGDLGAWPSSPAEEKKKRNEYLRDRTCITGVIFLRSPEKCEQITPVFM